MPACSCLLLLLLVLFCFSPRIACRGERRAPLFVLVLLFLVFYRFIALLTLGGPFCFGIPFLGMLACNHGNWPSQVLD